MTYGHFLATVSINRSLSITLAGLSSLLYHILCLKHKVIKQCVAEEWPHILREHKHNSNVEITTTLSLRKRKIFWNDCNRKPKGANALENFEEDFWGRYCPPNWEKNKVAEELGTEYLFQDGKAISLWHELMISRLEILGALLSQEGNIWWFAWGVAFPGIGWVRL